MTQRNRHKLRIATRYRTLRAGAKSELDGRI